VHVPAFTENKKALKINDLSAFGSEWFPFWWLSWDSNFVKYPADYQYFPRRLFLKVSIY